MVTHEINFLYEVKENHHIWLNAEIEYNVALIAKQDSAKTIGEITDDEANVYELPEKILVSEFYRQYKDEIEEERESEIAFETGKLKDF